VTSFDTASIVALQRAHLLSEILDARLQVLHQLPNATPPLLANEDELRARIVRWAATKVKVALAPANVRVDLGEAARVIDRAAAEVGAELIVVGAPETTSAPEVTTTPRRAGASRRIAARSIIAGLAGSLSKRFLLVAHPPRTRGELVAATDLRDVRCPVVDAAARLAESVAARVTVVHNLERSGPAFALALENVEGRLRMLERIAHELDGVRGGHVSTSRTTADAIIDVARSRDADITVVGIRRGGGQTFLSLLDHTPCSILVVPLPSASEPSNG
jgi:nucleotide-binding universal stress UspA family protein